MRLDKIMPEYQGRVRVRDRAFPLEIYGGGPPDRKELEVEMWLAAIQEPGAKFVPFGSIDWPTTTLPAFEAAWCANQQGEQAGHDFDLRIRRAFYAEGRNIGRGEVMLDLAREAGLDMGHFTRLFSSPEPRLAVLEEGRRGKEQYRVRGTPTIMLSDGTKLRHPLAYGEIREGKILSVGRLPCCGEGCYEITRTMFERALGQNQQQEYTKHLE